MRGNVTPWIGFSLPAVFIACSRRSLSVPKPAKQNGGQIGDHGSLWDSWPIAFSGYPRGPSYPQVSLLQQVKGVGTQISLTYVLTIEDPYRFPKSRAVGCFLGLRPGRRNSGESEPQKKISKEGDRYLRTMMVQGAHYILGSFGEDSDLWRWD